MVIKQKQGSTGHQSWGGLAEPSVSILLLLESLQMKLTVPGGEQERG